MTKSKNEKAPKTSVKRAAEAADFVAAKAPTKKADPTRQERIERMAYEHYLFRQAGRAPGDALSDWLLAEKKVDKARRS
jgi:hypothetical protein